MTIRIGKLTFMEATIGDLEMLLRIVGVPEPQLSAIAALNANMNADDDPSQPMSEIKRYGFLGNDRRDYVLYSDHLARIAQLEAQAQKLAKALSFYVSICGNTGYSITRESAMEAYAMASPLLAQKKAGEA